MPNYRIEIEYDGAAFAGWQRQDGQDVRSVQGEIARAILGFTGENVTPTSAGRTDSGVHALAMTASFHLAQPREPRVIRDAINAHLLLNLKDQCVAVLAATEVDEGFNARFSCVRRHYLYRIFARRAPSVLQRGRVWRPAQPEALDSNLMRQAATALVGHHDFSAFRTSICQAKSPVKTLETAEVLHVDDEIHLRFSARSFLHRQVRIMTGTLVEIGLGKRPITTITKAFATGQRHDAGETAPPDGLYFVRADYV